ncbi:uncharacterized protein RCO7_08729 [Rhynchosporium graminicola]|uniref:FAD-binding FR-type domain-containing protein n=1 Tax=Rhynchosporium graminicola TaxID=2792576 RepID=A0A1E1KCB7_9HELO|nr:uncharacterized protein RCO7_08729 [Rhynchosporium commune]
MSSSSAGINSVIGNISTSTDTTLLPLNDPGCNDTTCHAFQEAMDASQAEIPFASQFIYGHYIVFSYCAVVLFFKSESEFKTNPKIWQKIKALWRFFTYRNVGLGHGNRISTGQALFLIPGSVFVAMLTFQQKYYFRPRLSYGFPPLGVRTGVMALSLTPAIVALSGKFNLITLVTGMSYERLTVYHHWPAFNGLTWKTGQHVHLRFCGLKWWESHSFIITSLCDETFVTNKDGISTMSPLLFFIKPRKGLTRLLMKIAQQRETLKVLIDGPYGANNLDLIEGDEQIILVAGGSGISVILPLLTTICRRLAKAKSKLRSVRLIWVVKYRCALSWVREELSTALSMVCPGTLEIDLYITGEKNGTEQLAITFGEDDIEMVAEVDEEKEDGKDGDSGEQRLIHDSADFQDLKEDGSHDCLFIDDLDLEPGMDNGCGPPEHIQATDDEDEKLLLSQPREKRRIDIEYGIGCNVMHRRPDFRNLLPRLLLQGSRVCVVGCGPPEMHIDLGNAVAACQTRVLRGWVREVRLRTEAFGLKR